MEAVRHDPPAGLPWKSGIYFRDHLGQAQAESSVDAAQALAQLDYAVAYAERRRDGVYAPVHDALTTLRDDVRAHVEGGASLPASSAGLFFLFTSALARIQRFIRTADGVPAPLPLLVLLRDANRGASSADGRLLLPFHVDPVPVVTTHTAMFVPTLVGERNIKAQVLSEIVFERGPIYLSSVRMIGERSADAQRLAQYFEVAPDAAELQRRVTLLVESLGSGAVTMSRRQRQALVDGLFWSMQGFGARAALDVNAGEPARRLSGAIDAARTLIVRYEPTLLTVWGEELAANRERFPALVF